MDAEDVVLDPPNELIDSCLPSTANSRCNSIGTLTSWQLLAKQVANQQDSDENVPSRKQSPHLAELQCSPRSASWTSGVARIAPRPHQALYKEYRLLETIGKGAFGTVSLAVRRTDGKQLVAKEIASGQAALAPAKQRDAIMDEVNVLASMKHPNITKYYDCFMDANYLIIIMEWCNAGDLAGLIKRQAGQLMPESHVMFLFVQVCLAMHHVHDQGVLHRDLKTSNVLANKPTASTPASANVGHNSPAQAEFDALPILKLADFGVAKIGCDTDGSMAGTTVGTPHYLSPEMCDGKRYGKKTDVWALGCILYEIACQKKAFEASNIGGIYRKIAAAEYNPLPDLYSSDLKNLVRCLLAKDPKDRPSVPEMLCMPYVRHHLGAYLDWARNVPEAQPEVLLASISQSPEGALSPKVPASRTVSQQLLAHSIATNSNRARPLETSKSSSSSTIAGSIQNPSTALGGSAAASLQQRQSAVVPSVLHPPGMTSAHAGPLGASGKDGSPTVATMVTGSSARMTGARDEAAAAAQMQTSDVVCLSTDAKMPPAAQTAAAQHNIIQATSGDKKPSPFYSAAAALAALPGVQAEPGAGSVPAAFVPPSLLLTKHKLPAGGGSYSLDCWASLVGNEPSSELIMAFRNGPDIPGHRRVSSASCSSTANTPKSPLGQYMHSWQQDELQASVEQQLSTAVAATADGEAAADGEGSVDNAAPRAGNNQTTTHSTDECDARMVSVPLPWPWLTAGSDAQQTQRTSADNWLSTLVQSLQHLEQEPTADATQMPAGSTAAPMKAVASAGFKAWDVSMACINKESLIAAGMGSSAHLSRSNAIEGAQIPTSLDGWLPGDGNLLQQLQKRISRHSRTSYPGSNPSPLGGNSRSNRTTGDSSCSLNPLHPVSVLLRSSSGSLQKCSAGLHTAEGSPGANSAASAGMQQAQDAIAASARALVAPAEVSTVLPTLGKATASGDKSSTSSQKASKVTSVSVLAAADSAGMSEQSMEDDLPLAVMVKQCLSGNSFLYTRSPSPAQTHEHCADDCRTDAAGSPSISTCVSDVVSEHACSGQWAHEPETKVMLEQQEALKKFNKFRATLGIHGGSSMHCPMVSCGT